MVAGLGSGQAQIEARARVARPTSASRSNRLLGLRRDDAAGVADQGLTEAADRTPDRRAPEPCALR